MTMEHTLWHYDKLIINVETDGTISPETAIGLAARILQDQSQIFIKFEEEVIEDQVEKTPELPFNPLLLQKISDIIGNDDVGELSVRANNCLRNENIVYIGDLVQKTEKEMQQVKNFGAKSYYEVKKWLEGIGLGFGMSVSDWPPENLETLAEKYKDYEEKKC